SDAATKALVNGGASATTSGAIDVEATSNNTVLATSDSTTIGIIAVSVNAPPTARIAGGTMASYDGSIGSQVGGGASTLTVKADATNNATATITVASDGFFAAGFSGARACIGGN